MSNLNKNRLDKVFIYKGVGWIKEANKLGKYKNSYNGFRIYTLVKPSCTTRIEEREDGTYSVKEFTKGDYIAIDKYGVTYKGWYWDIIAKIDIDVLIQKMQK